MADRYRRDNGYRADRRYSNDYRRRTDMRDGYGSSYRRGHDDYRTSGYGRTENTRRTTNGAFCAQNESRGIGKKVIVVFIVFAIIIGNFILFAVLDDVENKKSENGSSVLSSGTDISIPKVSITDIDKARALKILADMSTEEKVGQLLLIRSNGKSADAFSELISQCKVGGIVLFKSDFEGKSRQEVIDMNAAFQAAGGGKLLICVDEEGGTVVRMSSFSSLRSEKYKSPQDLYKLGGYERIREDTVNKCEFLKTYGVNVNFAPVADVVTEKSAFMYKRAFGKNADATGEYVETVVEAMKENKVGSTIKHFPGYGNSKGDTHKGLDHNSSSIGALKASDLIPFEYGINAGADSIMVTHTIIDEVDSKNPASMSPECMSLIRDYLKFDGVVITDALDMGAIIEFCDGKDPSIQAFISGVDILCLPKDPAKAYNNLLDAVNDGTISQERLDESVLRIIRWKISLGLYD